MYEIYSDTAMVNKIPKWIKIVQCNGGNKVLLTYTLPKDYMWRRINAFSVYKSE